MLRRKYAVASSMANILSPFVLGQAVGVTCSGLFAFGTLSVSPFNAFSAVERSSLSVSDRSKLVTELLHSNGRKAFLSSVLVGSAAYLTAFIYRPATTSLAHSRVLHGAAIALLLAVPHTLVVMLPVYARLADVEGETKEAGEGESY
ncbi:hypothetical protein RQP46_004353 [Phenoliferia psychrophenolica]